jgi:hypothetical protein
MHTGCDAVSQPLDQLQTEGQMLMAGLKRVEERLETLTEAQEAIDVCGSRSLSLECAAVQ